MTEPRPPESRPLPASIAAYRIERVLGGGGTSTVYLAKHPDLLQPIALKVLPVELARTPAIRTRFLREGDTTARLTHPNVVAVYGRGETPDGQLWIAMQYIKGTDAESALQAGAMTRMRALRIIDEIAKVLDYAHLRGVIHQDVKPSNILLGERTEHHEHVVLGDFGAALTPQDGESTEGDLMVSVAYAAPEVLTGDRVDRRADVYSLGCTLFRLLSNRYPFPGDGGIAATITAHLQQSPPTLSDVLPWAGPALDEVIAIALAKDPNDRYATTREFAAAASRALRGSVKPPVARTGSPAADNPRASATQTEPRPVRSTRRRVVIGAIAAVVLVIAVLAWLAAPTPTPTPTPGPTPTVESSTRTAAVDGLRARLQALLPPGYPVGSCAPTTEAVLSCGRNLDPGGPASATYTLARSPEALHAQFDQMITSASQVVCPGNIQSPGPWRNTAAPNAIAGTVFCGISDGHPVVVWTNDSESRLARAESATDDMTALYTWWSSHCR